MSSFRSAFPFSRPAFLAVVHAVERPRTLANVTVALGEGADGVFLINHGIPAQELLEHFAATREEWPDAWLGLNLLDQSPHAALRLLPDSVRGWWTDDAGATDVSADVAHGLYDARTSGPHRHGALWFGGVSFKHQHDTLDIESAVAAAQLARSYVDVVTTSGTRTGAPPEIEKIRAMRAALGDHPLAIASGMTPGNVKPFAEFASAFLVATGISRAFDLLEPAKVRAFAAALR